MRSIADELSLTVDAAADEFRTIGEAEASHTRGPAVWSIKEILGHLVDSAANNHQRFVRAQFTQELAFPGYEQDAWVAAQHYQSRPWRDLVDLWVSYNRHLIHVIREMPDSASNTLCHIGTGEPKTVAFLVEDYLRHMRHHVQQIRSRRTGVVER